MGSLRGVPEGFEQLDAAMKAALKQPEAHRHFGNRLPDTEELTEIDHPDADPEASAEPVSPPDKP